MTDLTGKTPQDTFKSLMQFPTDADGVTAALQTIEDGKGVATTLQLSTILVNILGNLTLTGTVDGRDIDADGTKLDTVELNATADQTDAEIKTAYENNGNTNAFTDSEQTKLGGITAGATVNSTDAFLLARANHTGVQLIATISDAGALASLDTVSTTEIDNEAVILTKITNISTATILGRNTAGSGSPEELSATVVRAILNVENGATADQTDGEIKTAYENNADTNAFTDSDVTNLGNQSGTNTGDQTITLTGDVTGSGTGSFAATIAADSVTNAKAANVATATIKGRVTAATGDPEDLTGTQATTLLDTFTSALKGLVPASGGGTTNFLRADGTFAVPAGAGSTKFQTTDQTITAAGALTLAHGLGALPDNVVTVLVNTTAEFNYSIGDIAIIDIVQSSSANQGASVSPDTTNINVRFGSGTGGGSAVFKIINKTTGASENATNASWDVYFIAVIF